MIAIYDNDGTIWYNGTGDKIPDGLPYIEYTERIGKYLTRIDMSVTPPVPIFTDYPKSEIQILKEINEQQQADIDYLMLLLE